MVCLECRQVTPHLILDQKVHFTLISIAHRYTMKGYFVFGLFFLFFVFFLLMKFFTVCFISTFWFLKKKCNKVFRVYVFVNDICVSLTLCVQCVLISRGNWTRRVGEERMDSLFFHAKNTHTHTHTNYGKTQDYCKLSTISKSQVCYWC